MKDLIFKIEQEDKTNCDFVGLFCIKQKKYPKYALNELITEYNHWHKNNCKCKKV